MNRRNENSSNPVELKPGDIELEMGIPIPGTIRAKEEWTQTAIKKLPETGPIDWTTLFQRQAPLAIDVGCGNGRFTISSAVRRADWNHLGIDILPAVIRYATRRGNQRGLSNVRFAVCDGWKLFDLYLADESVDEVHIYHPQPYASVNDVSKRMLTPQYLGLLVRKLKPGGKVFLQTDRKAYWQYMQQSFQKLFDWHEQLEPWSEDPHGRSRREMISQDQKLTIFRGVATRRETSDYLQIEETIASMLQPQFKVDRPKPFRRRR